MNEQQLVDILQSRTVAIGLCLTVVGLVQYFSPALVPPVLYVLGGLVAGFGRAYQVVTE